MVTATIFCQKTFAVRCILRYASRETTTDARKVSVNYTLS